MAKETRSGNTYSLHWPLPAAEPSLKLASCATPFHKYYEPVYERGYLHSYLFSSLIRCSPLHLNCSKQQLLDTSSSENHQKILLLPRFWLKEQRSGPVGSFQWDVSALFSLDGDGSIFPSVEDDPEASASAPSMLMTSVGSSR